jgi:hypothetical protein
MVDERRLSIDHDAAPVPAEGVVGRHIDTEFYPLWKEEDAMPPGGGPKSEYEEPPATRVSQAPVRSFLPLRVPLLESPVLPPPPEVNVNILRANASLEHLASTPLLPPRRISFQGGTVMFFRRLVVVTNKQHPLGVSLPVELLDYECASKSKSCTLTAGSIKVRANFSTDYKEAVAILGQMK